MNHCNACSGSGMTLDPVLFRRGVCGVCHGKNDQLSNVCDDQSVQSRIDEGQGRVPELRSKVLQLVWRLWKGP